jgi:hypothetical protein
MEKETVQANMDTIDEHQMLKFLLPAQISMIDEALSAVGDFGEVRLVVEKGRLRFVVTQRSFDAQKWQPGELSRRAKFPRLSF